MIVSTPAVAVPREWRRLWLPVCCTAALFAGAWRHYERTLPPALSHARLVGASLRRAVLARADLCGADLRGADLRSADLAETNLACACLRGATLRGADLAGACLRGADLAGADFRGARYDARTDWPAGFDPEARGARRVEQWGGAWHTMPPGSEQARI